MLLGDQRTCDICDQTIRRGTPFRVGYATKEAFEISTSRLTEATTPGHTLIEDLVVRFEICMECWRECEETELLSDEEVDPLH